MTSATDNRTTELLSCPFCGGEAAIYEEIIGGYIVQCHDCCGQVGIMTKEHAIAAWNQRHVDTCENMREKFGYKRLFVCSECGVTFDPDCEINYCPCCGRKVVDNAD